MSIIFDFVPQVRNLFYSKTSRIQKLVVKIWAEFPQKKSETNLIFAIAYKIFVFRNINKFPFWIRQKS